VPQIAFYPFYTSEAGTYCVVDLGLNEVDGDFYSGVNVTDGGGSSRRACAGTALNSKSEKRNGRRGVQDPISALADFVEAAQAPYLVAHLRSAQPRPSAHLVLPHQSAVFGKKKAGPALTDASERSTEKIS
jgi:hypothetical protein